MVGGLLSAGLVDSQPLVTVRGPRIELLGAGGQEGPAVAHVEPASDWVAVNTNPAADYRWHGEINSNK